METKMINKNDLIEDLKQVKNKIGSIPSINRYRKYGIYNPATFHRRFGSWNNALTECFGQIIQERPQERPIIKCLQCGLKTKNPKFCSSNCSATYNNIKRTIHIKNNCIKCGEKIQSRCTCCIKCLPLYKLEKYGEKIIKQFRDIPASKNRYQDVRNHAHRVAKYYDIKEKCHYCNYKNHFQLCHIKDIGKFPADASLNEINDPQNLIYLCPNHHWDLDHGYLEL